jgi:glycosyltransferase involved in cell wall biosynthesis
MVFTGAMDYHANVDGVLWFAEQVLPRVREKHPDSLFAVVGSNPAGAVRSLADQPGVMVTGRVPDVRPYLAHARVAVAPLRIARGVQNKVLEALAMARAIVATENAVQGIPGAAQAGVVVTAEPFKFAESVISCLESHQIRDQGRNFVLGNYSWARQVEELSGLLEAMNCPSRVEYEGPR